MFELNKKQVGALIKIIDKHDFRPVMGYLRIDTMQDQPNLVAVATNGFVMAVLQTSLNAEEHKALIGHGVHVDSFKQWYATAGAKDLFTEVELMAQATDINQSFDWQRAIPSVPEPVATLAIDSNLLKLLEGVAGSTLRYTTHGDRGPLVAKKIGAMYLIMPMAA